MLLKILSALVFISILADFTLLAVALIGFPVNVGTIGIFLGVTVFLGVTLFVVADQEDAL